MPDVETVKETVNRLQGMHQGLDFDIEGDLQERESDSEVIYEFLHRQRPGWQVATWGTTERNYAGLEYRYDLLTDLTQQLSEDQVKEWADPLEEIDDVQEATYAAANILSAIDPDTRADIYYQLSNKLTTGDTWVSVDEQFGISFSRFTVVSRVFPYDDNEGGLREYEEAMKKVMNTGSLGHRFLRYTLKLDAAGEGDTIPDMIADQR